MWHPSNDVLGTQGCLSNMIWNHSHCNPPGQCCTENNFPLSWKPIPITKKNNKNKQHHVLNNFQGRVFLSCLHFATNLGSGNKKKSPGHKLSKLQIFGKGIVLISLEALNKLENLGDPREPINPRVLNTKVFYQQTMRWFRACPNTTTIGTWDNEAQ